MEQTDKGTAEYRKAFAEWSVATFHLFEAIGIKPEDYKGIVDAMMNALQLRLINKKMYSLLRKS